MSDIKVSEILKKVYPIGLPFVYFGNYGLSSLTNNIDKNFNQVSNQDKPKISGQEFEVGNESIDHQQFYDTEHLNSKGVTYWSSYKGVPVFMPVFIDGFEMPNCVITISGGKKIVDTEIVGQEGTVKELIANNDYSISLISVVLGDERIYPEAYVEHLLNIYRENKTRTIENVMTSYLLQAKNNCVITSINLPNMQGVMDSQVIEMQLKSDRSFELVIN